MEDKVSLTPESSWCIPGASAYLFYIGESIALPMHSTSILESFNKCFHHCFEQFPSSIVDPSLLSKERNKMQEKGKGQRMEGKGEEGMEWEERKERERKEEGKGEEEGG